MRLVTTTEFLDLIGTEPAEPDEAGPAHPEYAPATSADIAQMAAQIGWLAPGRYLPLAVPLTSQREQTVTDR